MVGNQDKDKKEKCPRLLVAPAIENPPRHHQIQKSGNRRAEPRLFGVIPRVVAGEEHAANPCPALPFSGCLIDHEHENDREHDQITIRRRYSGSGA